MVAVLLLVTAADTTEMDMRVGIQSVGEECRENSSGLSIFCLSANQQSTLIVGTKGCFRVLNLQYKSYILNKCCKITY